MSLSAVGEEGGNSLTSLQVLSNFMLGPALEFCMAFLVFAPEFCRMWSIYSLSDLVFPWYTAAKYHSGHLTEKICFVTPPLPYPNLQLQNWTFKKGAIFTKEGPPIDL